MEIRASTRDLTGWVSLGFNYTKEDPRGAVWPRYSRGDDWSKTVVDGTIQTYHLSLGTRSPNWQGSWKHLMIICASDTDVKTSTFDILSVRVVPKVASFANAAVGVRYEVRDQMHRRTIITHTPGKLQYLLRTPQAGRLDVGLGVFKEDAPVDFKITAKPDGVDAVTVLEETYADHEHWAQRCIDLSDFSEKIITLSLEADSKRAGTVAFWSEPTVSGRRRMERPLPSTLIWDTQSPFVDEVDLRDRSNWRIATVTNLWIPATHGRRYVFKGDAVVENELLLVMFWSEKGRVIVYSKTNPNQKKVELVSLRLK